MSREIERRNLNTQVLNPVSGHIPTNVGAQDKICTVLGNYRAGT